MRDARLTEPSWYGRRSSLSTTRKITAIELILFLIAPASALAAGCDGAVGDWKWFNGGVVTLTQQKTVLMNGKAEGKWVCSDPNRAALVVRWNAGFVDTLTVNANRMTGKNQQNVPISAERKMTVPHK